MKRISIPIGTSGQELVYEPDVLRHFSRNRQFSSPSKEAGGQLFAKFVGSSIRIVVATGPYPSDKRTRVSFAPNRALENKEIRSMFKRGLHYIGDWHTHPEKRPKPSAIDVASMRDCFQKSTHRLNFFVLSIVGNEQARLCISTMLCNQSACILIDEQH
ncbi:Mov34/MPN/PAD-1 family protein [Pacificispira sp.]|uniref:Mov34/MPN/PAD-1 family protein n=1 Tax=Pacificispira sp. TaxID=2888761 RepID=UPI003B515A23